MAYLLKVNNDSSTNYNHRAVDAFIILNLIGGIGMLLVLLTSLIFRQVKRVATWYSLCFSWALSATAYALLFLSGEKNNAHPNHSVCYIQAALVYAMPPTTTSATLAILVHILLSLPDSLSERWNVVSVRTSCMLVMTPFIILLIIFIGVAMYQTANPQSLQRAVQGTYCNSMNASWSRVSFSIVAALSIIILVVQGRLAARLYANMPHVESSTHWIATSARVMLFTLTVFTTLVIAMVFTITNDHNMAFDLILATFPLSAFLVFGTERDLVRAWFSWQRPRRAEA